MDLEVFGQSLIESSPNQLDDSEFFPLSPGPSSPLVSQPPTPIQPTSPHELYPSSYPEVNEIGNVKETSTNFFSISFFRRNCFPSSPTSAFW